MRSLLGLLSAGVVGVAFVIAWWLSQRPGASWLDAQWLFLAALPFNWTVVRISGESNFAPDATAQVVAALLFDATLAYLGGGLVEALARGGFRLARRLFRA